MVWLDVFGSESVASSLLQQVLDVTVFPVPAAVLTERSETAAMDTFSGVL